MVLEQVRSNTTVILAWFTFCPYFCTTYLETFGLKFHLKVSFSRSQFEKALAMFTIHEIKNAICTFHLFSAAKFVFQKLKFLLKQEYKLRKTKQSSAFVVALNIFAASSIKRRGRPQLVWPFKVPWNWRQFLKRMQRWRHPDLIPKLLTYFSQKN